MYCALSIGDVGAQLIPGLAPAFIKVLVPGAEKMLSNEGPRHPSGFRLYSRPSQAENGVHRAASPLGMVDFRQFNSLM